MRCRITYINTCSAFRTNTKHELNDLSYAFYLLKLFESALPISTIASKKTPNRFYNIENAIIDKMLKQRIVFARHLHTRLLSNNRISVKLLIIIMVPFSVRYGKQQRIVLYSIIFRLLVAVANHKKAINIVMIRNYGKMLSMEFIGISVKIALILWLFRKFRQKSWNHLSWWAFGVFALLSSHLVRSILLGYDWACNCE